MYFRNDWRLVGWFSQCDYESLKAFFQITLRKNRAAPGGIVSIQTFGDLVNFHPHLHAIAPDGVFTANGWFYALPKTNPDHPMAASRHRVLIMFRRERKVEDELIKKLLGWRNSGFSIHNQVRIESQDRPWREKLAQYILRSTFCQEKVR